MTAMVNGSGKGIATISKARRLLQMASTIDEFRHVENLAQLARDYAKKARLGRDSINSAARLALDARRKAGEALKGMRQRGELADGRQPKALRPAELSHAAIVYCLHDLGLTISQSSRYQQEASVPQAVYEAWVQRIFDSTDGVLTAAALRALARRPDDSRLLFATAASRVRRLVAKLRERMDDDGRARLPGFLESLASEYEGDNDG